MNQIKALLEKNPEACIGNLIPDLQLIVDSRKAQANDRIYFKHKGAEYVAYADKELALAIALLNAAELWGDEEIGEYLASDSAFSVVRIERPSKNYYDFLCDGYNTNFEGALDVDDWYQMGWNYVCFDGMWNKREDWMKHEYR